METQQCGKKSEFDKDKAQGQVFHTTMKVGGRTICLTFEEKKKKKVERDCKIYFPARISRKTILEGTLTEG
jgi:hypothetical protein